jgi:hypothetical protein
MGECRACRWWRLESGLEGSAIADWGECSLAESESDAPKVSTTRAYAYDCEQYKAGLLTAPDFGCNQWTAKEPT